MRNYKSSRNRHSSGIFVDQKKKQPVGRQRNTPVVGRAELKIAEAASSFKYDFRGKIALDIGSSTGGFTEYALARGAKKVYAVEKGTNQMKAPLRYDKRIVLYEKTDIFNVWAKKNVKNNRGGGIEEAEDNKKVVQLSENLDTILADVSFVSLTKILRHASYALASANTDFLVMLKPQFEAKPEQLVRGVVKNEKIRREIIKNFEFWLRQNGFLIISKHDNGLTGRTGNSERFYWLKIAKR